MEGSPLFLDTTVFADRLFGGGERARSIRALLANRPVVSSNYVREQFRATFLRAAVLTYNLLLEKGDPLEVIRLTDNYSFFTTGDGVKARKILVTLLQNGATDATDKLASLERLIEFDMMRQFDTMALLIDATQCCQCPDDPVRDENGFYRFKKLCSIADPRPCVIEKFWTERLNELSNLAEADRQEHKQLANTISAAAETIQGNPPRGRRCFVHLSDAVICAEAEQGSTLVTSNLRDFVPLTRIMGGKRPAVSYALEGRSR